MSLDDYLAGRPDRCACGLHVPTQGCACAALAAKARGQATATTANPYGFARVGAVIRQLAATGQPFDANTARPLHGETGPIVGAAFTAAKAAGLIEQVGDTTSTSTSTHGHRVYRWRGTTTGRTAA